MAEFCKKCFLSDNVEGVLIDENQLCDYCAKKKEDDWSHRFQITEEQKKSLREELEKYYNNIKGKADYDCVLALSGGKDSTYLLYHFIIEKGMKVLAVHVNTHFESNIGIRNIKLLQKKLSFDLEEVDFGFDFFKKFYRHLFLNPIKEGYVKNICYICGPLYISCCLKVATEKKIPLVVLGLSPNQPENMFFEWVDDIIKQKDWIPDIFKTEEFDNDFKDKFWNPFKYPEDTLFPRLIAPLHIMEYNEKQIIDKLSKHKILSKKQLNPATTNCILNWPMIYLDTRLLGHNPYIKEFSSKVRRKEISRIFWKILFSILNWQIKLGIFKKGVIKKIEKILNMKFSDCLIDKKIIQRRFKEYP